MKKLTPLGRFLSHPTTYLVLAAALLVAHALYLSSLMGYDVVDDAYISFRYALNAARGYGLTFNVGERRVEGYTNFLWTVMLIPAFWLKLPIHVTSMVLGLLWALGTILLLNRSAAHRVPSSQWTASAHALQARWLGPVAALLLAADGSFALWSVGGLESSLFAALVLAGALAYVREMRDPARVPLSGAWFALAAMTRPEGLLVYGLTGLHQVATRLIRERKLATRQDWQRLGLFGLIWAPWFAFRWRYYGYPLPNTFYAKVTLGDSAAQRARGLAYVGTFIRIHLGYAPLAIALLPLLRRRWRLWASYLVLIVVAYGAYIAYVGGDWSVGRFFVPLMPLFYALLAGGLIVTGEWLAHQLRCWRTFPRGLERGPSPLSQWNSMGGLAVAAIGALCAGLLIQSSLNGEKALFLDRFDARLAGRARTAMGKWLGENVSPETHIAVDAAGQIPFYSDLKALDLYGLNDLTIAHRPVQDMGKGTPGHEKMDMDYVIYVAQPDYIIIYGTAFDWLSAFSYRRVDLPWTDDPVLKAFLGVYERQ
jgi:arabinofuranosyltransferase